MEYEFSQDFTGPEARFSMGHEAFGYWLTQEIGARTDKLTEISNALNKLTQGTAWDAEITGFEYDLILSRDDAMVRAHALSSGDDLDLEEDMDFYDSESSARCGLEDFAELIAKWAEFVGYSG
ncbi:YacL family protein [Pontibacterium granulatum]|uniref:UPF0231 family protein n=1 Tax=Pontibacterium granulatum TaxID=2036029 RepID=UPI002499D3CD|nr:YacL family protein [Pontibacterium granulatum]